MAVIIGDGCCPSAMVLWSLSIITSRLSIQQTLLRLPDPDGGEVRIAACLQLALVFVFVPRWSNNLFIILLFSGLFIVLPLVININQLIFARETLRETHGTGETKWHVHVKEINYMKFEVHRKSH
jgi:hypothetical protein